MPELNRCYRKALEPVGALLAWNLQEHDCSSNKEATELRGI